MRARARSEKICACAYQKCENPRLRTRANIKLSLKYCVWMDKFTQKLCQNARLGKYPIADIAGWTYSISALDQCILLKWQHFLNINQKATTKKSLTALDLIAFLTLKNFILTLFLFDSIVFSLNLPNHTETVTLKRWYEPNREKVEPSHP